MTCPRCGSPVMNGKCVSCGADCPNNMYTQNFSQGPVCPVCGKPVNPNESFCTYCGTAQNINAQPVDNGSSGAQKTIWILGLVGLICGILGNIAGIVCSAIALSRAKSYVLTYGFLDGKAATGKKMATAGLIVSIIMIVLSFILGMVYSFIMFGMMYM